RSYREQMSAIERRSLLPLMAELRHTRTIKPLAFFAKRYLFAAITLFFRSAFFVRRTDLARIIRHDDADSTKYLERSALSVMLNVVDAGSAVRDSWLPCSVDRCAVE